MDQYYRKMPRICYRVINLFGCISSEPNSFDCPEIVKHAQDNDCELTWEECKFGKLFKRGETMEAIYNFGNIKTMEELSTRPGFMFFNNSIEGQEFWKNNPITLI